MSQKMASGQPLTDEDRWPWLASDKEKRPGTDPRQRLCVVRVGILVVRDDLIAEARLYIEPVEMAGDDIEAAVQELCKPPTGQTP
jgi:hypothetical protein